MSLITLYSDGAYSSSRNRGGWAFVIVKDNVKVFSDYGDVNDTTNNRMEIFSCIKALEWCKVNNILEVQVISDSMYLIGTLSKGWKKKKNIDLWLKLEEVIEGLTIDWKHVKGHSGDQWNEYCDTLAVYAYNY